MDTLTISVTKFGNLSEIFSKNVNYSICTFDKIIFRNVLENPETENSRFQLRSIQPRSADLGRSDKTSLHVAPFARMRASPCLFSGPLVSLKSMGSSGVTVGLICGLSMMAVL